MSLWSHSEGERPHTVVVYERQEGGILYVRAWHAQSKRWCRVSLGHRDKQRAKAHAREVAVKLERGDTMESTTISEVFTAYLRHHTPKKVETEQVADHRRAEMWARVLGRTNPYDISSVQWMDFIDARRSGAIDP